MKKIKRKSLLYKSDVEYGDYTINHVHGCSHGCMYPCYAMLMAKRFGRVKTYDEWMEPEIVENAIELLEKEIPRLKHKINFVHLCFMTDPFMTGYPEVTDLTLKIINLLNDYNLKVTLLTKGLLPKRLTKIQKYRPYNEYGISLVSLDENFRENFEPNSSTYEKRIDSLHHLHENGLNTWVSIEPYPTPNIVEQDINGLLERIDFVNKIVFGRMNYNKLISEYKAYQEFYNETTERVSAFCRKHNIEFHIKEKTLRKPDKTAKAALEKSKRIFRRVIT